jgi:hypothetical protein
MRRALATACLLASLALPAAASADGDPASDVLLLQDTYLPYTPQVPKPLGDALTRMLNAGKKKGFKLKVAVIATKNDLGSVPQFFGRPQPYAAFLQSEIAFNKPKPLLVVMPGGFGTAELGPGAAGALQGVKPPASASGDDMGRAAIDATLKLAKASGVSLPAPTLPKSSSGGGGGGTSPAIVFGVPVLLLALGGVLAALRSRQTREAEAEAETGVGSGGSAA